MVFIFIQTGEMALGSCFRSDTSYCRGLGEEKMNKYISYILAGITILGFLVGSITSYNKLEAKVEKVSEKAEKAEGTLDEMKEFRAEQRIQIKVLDEKLEEQKEDLKSILQEIRALK